MSTSLDIVAYPHGRKFAAVETFCCLVEAVSKWHPIDQMWSDFKIGKGWLSNRYSRVEGPLNSTAVLRAAWECPLQRQRHISASIPFQCWRHMSNSTVLDHAVLSVEAWDVDCEMLAHGELEMEGYARVSINHANPYWIVLDESSVEGAGEYNERATENLDALGELLIILAKSLEPKSMKVFVDEGLRLPCNSHCAYYGHPAAVIDDLEVIDGAWLRGLPSYTEPPLSSGGPEDHKWALSLLRSPEQREELWQDLAARFPLKSPVPAEAVADAIEVTGLDIHRVDSGFFVFDYPHFLNSFVAQFYLDVLDV